MAKPWLKEFARITEGNAHIIILGRNRVAAESIISQFPKPTSSDAVHEFVECDVSLMKNVEKVTESLLSRLPRLNFLVLSTGAIDLMKPKKVFQRSWLYFTMLGGNSSRTLSLFFKKRKRADKLRASCLFSLLCDQTRYIWIT